VRNIHKLCCSAHSQQLFPSSARAFNRFSRAEKAVFHEKSAGKPILYEKSQKTPSRHMQCNKGRVDVNAGAYSSTQQLKVHATGKGGIMNTTSNPTLRVWELELSLQGEENDLLLLNCQGAISLPDFQPETDPFLKMLGPEVYSRKLLLNLEQASLLDTSGISWLIHCHETCSRAGGILVLYAIPRRVRYILQLLQMEHLFHTATDATAARAIAVKGGV
jgi:anti-anti-sigma regulatory factor